MKFDSLKYENHSRRNLVYSKNGMVCTSQPLAAEVGIEILRKGGNAVDAAVATAAAMTVLEPTSNALGSDAFALVYFDGKLRGLNASGFSPKALSLDAVKNLGYKEMPKRGWLPVMVPGAVAGRAELTKEFGNLSLMENLKPAIKYAEEGYPVAPVTAKMWKKAYYDYKEHLKEDYFKSWFDFYAPKGRPPRAGEIIAFKDMAETLGLIGESKGQALYKGILAEKIDEFSRKTRGFIRKEDLEDYKCEWVDPISVNYRGYDIWELPPNGDGIIALMALNIAKGFDFNGNNLTDIYHKQIEAMKLAFVDGQKQISDIRFMEEKIENLLSEDLAERRRDLIEEKALNPDTLDPKSSGTIYLCTGDKDGNMVSFIQSNYFGFGSGIVVPGTGISLQNRGMGFSMDPTSPNCLAPRKKSFHTIIPGFITKDKEAVGPFGIMGGFMQPQGHLQIISKMIDFGMNPQAALDAPRWFWEGGKKVKIEKDFPSHIAEELIRRGHEIEVSLEEASFGRGQIIIKTEDGTYAGATEPRADGSVAVY